MNAQDPAAPDLFASAEGGSTFDVWAFLWTAKRFWWLIAICVIAGGAVGFVLARMEKREYIATAEIKVERRASSSAISLSGVSSALEGATTPEDLKTIEKSFVNPGLMQRLAPQLRGDAFAGLEFEGFPVAELSDEAVAGFLYNGCTVALVPETRLIQISFRSGDPAMAQLIADLIVEEGIQNDLDQRIVASGASIRYLKEEVKKFEENLRTSEEKLNAYTRTLGNVSIDADLNMVANQLRELTSRGTVIKSERIRLENEYAQVQTRIGDPGKLMQIESIQRLPSIVNLSAQVAEVEAKVAKLSLRYRESNPFMRQAQLELAELQENLRKEILAAPKSIETALASARQAEEASIREQKLQEERVIQVRDLSVPSRVLQRQIDADRLALEAALKRLTEELSQARSQPVLIQLVNPAGYGMPVASKAMKTLGVSLFLGAMLGFGGVFLIMQLDTSLKSPEEASKLLGLPILSHVPTYGDPKTAGVPERSGLVGDCPALDDKYSPAAEAFRSLRAAVRSMYDEEAGHAVLVTAPMPGDGSTFCALNLAVVFAQAGQRTLLVDANLRNPSIQKLLLRGGHRVGLSEFLSREAGLASAISPSPLPLLDVVPAGGACPFPAEVLSRERFGVLLDELRPLYDKIVVDSAPVSVFSDTLGFARLFPFVCVVLGAGKTPKEAAKRSIELLRHSGAKPSGIVFNATPVVESKRLLGGTTEIAATVSPPKAFLTCSACGKSYSSFGGFLAKTQPAAHTNGAGQRAPTSKVLRVCSCGCELAGSLDNLRDLSGAGEERRRVFGEMLSWLESGGMSSSEARQYLLLNLKLWSNEVADDARADSSQAAAQRTRMMDDLLARLAKAGFSNEEAKSKMKSALETWRASVK